MLKDKQHLIFFFFLLQLLWLLVLLSRKQDIEKLEWKSDRIFIRSLTIKATVVDMFKVSSL